MTDLTIDTNKGTLAGLRLASTNATMCTFIIVVIVFIITISFTNLTLYSSEGTLAG